MLSFFQSSMASMLEGIKSLVEGLLATSRRHGEVCREFQHYRQRARDKEKRLREELTPNRVSTFRKGFEGALRQLRARGYLPLEPDAWFADWQAAFKASFPNILVFRAQTSLPAPWQDWIHSWLPRQAESRLEVVSFSSGFLFCSVLSLVKELM